MFKGKFSSNGLYANAIFQKSNEAIIPFIGVGLGFALLKTHETTTDSSIISGGRAVASGSIKISENSIKNFSWQILGGIDFNLTKGLFLGFMGRVTCLGDGESGNPSTINQTLGDEPASGNIDAKYKTNKLYAADALTGIRYQF
ncbi:MAG: hypothetical protein HQK53_13920 [Oligoflexia bacterium]|nr:hypothetical protein [Oligoflexia bacterium]